MRFERESFNRCGKHCKTRYLDILFSWTNAEDRGSGVGKKWRVVVCFGAIAQISSAPKEIMQASGFKAERRSDPSTSPEKALISWLSVPTRMPGDGPESSSGSNQLLIYRAVLRNSVIGIKMQASLVGVYWRVEQFKEEVPMGRRLQNPFND